MTYSFIQTSDGLYDRHYYKLIFNNGKEKIFDDYTELREFWFTSDNQFLSHVEVLDNVKSSNKKKNGFK